ncbi:MAG: hypothetical protein ACRDV2_17640, partial [Actinomycetes bacterium]
MSRSWTARHPVLTVIGVLVALFVAVAAFGDDGPETVRPTAAGAEASVSARPSATSTTIPSSPSPTQSAAQSADQAIAQAGPRTALSSLGDLAVKGRAPKTGYD